MGATNYSDLVVIKGDESNAFRQAVEEANDYNGHQEGYSGDIQTADGFRMPRVHPRYGTKAFENWEEKITWGEMDKGDCICIEIKGAVLKRIKERRGLKGKKGYRAFYFFGLGNY